MTNLTDDEVEVERGGMRAMRDYPTVITRQEWTTVQTNLALFGQKLDMLLDRHREYDAKIEKLSARIGQLERMADHGLGRGSVWERLVGWAVPASITLLAASQFWRTL